MTVVAECLIAPAAEPLGPGMTVPESTTVELERVVPTDEGLCPYLWIRGDAVDAYIEQVRTGGAAAEVHVLEREADRALLRVDWSAAGVPLLARILAEGGTILKVHGRSDGWLIEVRAPERDVIERLHRHCRDENMAFELLRITDGATDDDRPFGLTAEQYETLVAAYRAGYYEEPRDTDLERLGEAFDVTARAVSRRLRRGTATLVRNALGVAREGTLDVAATATDRSGGADARDGPERTDDEGDGPIDVETGEAPEHDP